MADQTFQEIFDDSKIIESLERIEKQLGDVDKTAKATANGMADSFDQVGASAENLGDAMERNTTAVMRQAKAVSDAQKSNQTWLQSIKQTIAGQQIGGKSLGEWAQQAKGFASKIAESAKATEGASIAMRIFNGLLKASGIGLLVGLLGSVIAYFTRFQSGIDKVNQLLAGLSAAVGVIFDRIAALGGAIVKFFSGDFSGAAADAKAAFSGVGAAIVDAAAAAYELEKRAQSLRDTTLTMLADASRLKVQIEQLRQVSEDETKTIRARAAAAKEAGTLEQKIADDAFDRALEAFELEKGRFAISTKNFEDKQKLQQAQAALDEATIERNRVIYNAEKDQRDFRQKAAEEARKAAEKRKKDLEDEAKALEKIAKDLESLRVAAQPEGIEKDLAAVNKKYDDLAKVAAAGVKKLNEIEGRRILSPEELAQRAELIAIEKQLEERRLDGLLDVVSEYAEKDFEAEQELQKRKADLRKKDHEQQVKDLEDAKKLRDQQIDIAAAEAEGFTKRLAASGAGEREVAAAQKEFDTQVKEARLRNELQFQEALLAITDQGDKNQIARIKATIDLIKTELGNLQVPEREKPRSLWDILGITDPEGQKGLEDAAKSIVDSLSQIADARLKEAEAATAAADAKVKAAEDAYNKEKDAAEKGLANNLSIRKRELDAATRQQEEAQKQEAKARRAAILLDSVSQVSGLITASANIFKATSVLGPFGVGIGIAAIALMIGAFVKAKADALKAVPKLRKGGKIEGRTHEHGGELAVSDSGQYYELERGEWVIGTKHSREHDAFLERLNKGEFAGVDLNRMAGKGGNPISDAIPAIMGLQEKRAELSEAQHWSAMMRAYQAGAGQIVEAIKGRPNVYPWKGGYIKETKSGNVTERKTVIPDN